MPDGDTFMLNNELMNNIKTVYTSSKHIAIDEMLRKFFGRFTFKHRMPSKPVKRNSIKTACN